MNKKWQLVVAGAVLASAFVAPAVEASTYTVQKGDNLTKIAKAHKTTIENIKQWNRLKDDTIFVNQKLVVEKGAATQQAKPTATKPEKKPQATATKPVAVKPEKKPQATATKPVAAKPEKKPQATAAKPVAVKPEKKPQATAAKPAAARPVNTVQEEKVPTKNQATSSATHTVVKGDTLTNIAQKHKTTVVTLKKVNQLETDMIRLGQVLIIKQGEQEEKAPISVAPPTVETVESEEVFTPMQIQSVEEMIAKQLAAEKIITSSPNATVQARYSEVLQVAEQLKGIPYVYGGNTTAGFDCSGFVSYVYKMAGFDITRKSSLNYFLEDTTQVQAPVPGDFVFFKNTYISTISHMGIYLGDNQFIHAGSRGIEIANLETTYWNDRFVAFKRYTAN